jgi:hypothetical protein
MDWLFAKDHAGWPEHFIYALEFAFVGGWIVAFHAASAIDDRRSGLRSLVSGLGVLIGAIAISFPILLAPLFFHVAGEWMMATIPAMIVVFPLALFATSRMFKEA